jgi:tRNA(Arg) A34 adenosine deaminase TadA
VKKILVILLIFVSHVIYGSTIIDYNNSMLQLIQLAQTSNLKYPFTAMIVDNNSGQILCTGVNSVGNEHNPTLHGEKVAINACVNKYGKKMNWHNTTLITTAEPCPMCMSAIIWAGISKVVYGTSIKYLSELGWKQINIDSHEVLAKAPFSKVTIVGKVMESQTNLLFIKSKQLQ